MVWLAAELSKVADPAEQAELAKQAATGRLKRDELKKRTSTPQKSRGVGKTRLGGAAIPALGRGQKLGQGGLQDGN